MSNNIAIYNFKGGVGKTTSALNIGYNWSRLFKVLLIDADPQCNLTNSLAPLKKATAPTLHDIFRQLLHDQRVEIKPFEIHPYLHLIPGDYRMSEVESHQQFVHEGYEIVRKLLLNLNKDYDLVLIDCPTHFGFYLKSILQNINSILIPNVADAFSITGAETLVNHLKSIENIKQINILGMFFNMYRNDRIQNRKVFEYTQELFGNILLDTTISTSIKLREATSQGLPISSYLPDHKISKQFSELSEELLTKLFEQKAFNPDEINAAIRKLSQIKD
ncbi:ParA family protein [Marinoscillum sp. MHG1-6]|uniref:ParA family protein n=1 Tax=Marinoscillum sp. MHG1-6 TaxID=2959627 RepID=UPI00215731AB|nr:ParA family protein [Marinoscillum sp. MHG1-6]